MNLAPRQSDHLDDNEVELAGSNVSQRKKCVSEDGRIFNEKEDGVDASIGGLAGGAVIHRLSCLRKCASVQVCLCVCANVHNQHLPRTSHVVSRRVRAGKQLRGNVWTSKWVRHALTSDTSPLLSGLTFIDVIYFHITSTGACMA